jgi:hypothetical protein
MTNCMEQNPSSEAGRGPVSQDNSHRMCWHSSNVIDSYLESLPGIRLYCIIASVAFFPPSGEH